MELKEFAWWLRALASLLEDPGLILCTHTETWIYL